MDVKKVLLLIELTKGKDKEENDMNKFVKSLIICISTLVLVVPVMSQSFSNKVVIHGYISQGYMKSTHNNYLIPTKDGSYEFNEAAVNFTTHVADNLRMGLQFFSRDYGKEGNNDVLLDWAYADYLWKDALGIRLGKIKIPVGFYNQIRDIDLLRTSILLPQGVYEEGMRDFLLAHQGASLYGNIPLLYAGSFDYEVIGGSLSIPDPRTGFWRFVFLDLLDNVTQFYPDGTVGSVRDPSVTGKYVLGGTLKWNTPLQGLRLGEEAFHTCPFRADWPQGQVTSLCREVEGHRPRQRLKSAACCLLRRSDSA